MALYEKPRHNTSTSTSSSQLSTIDTLGMKINQISQRNFDKILPPEQRQDFLAKIQAFISANPKTSAFLATNILLTAIPIILFGIFIFSTAVFSLITGLLIGLGGAVLFTLAWAGIALMILFPIVFLTTAAACCLFCWGVSGYYVLYWTGVIRRNESKSAAELRGVEDVRVNGVR